jgi:hypothetical protein
VSVFDANTAGTHVSETNDVAYTPFPMKVMERLTQTCLRIRETLTAEADGLARGTPLAIREPKCRPHTAVGKCLARLSGATDPAAVRALAALTAEETARLVTLASDLAHDPAAAAARLERFRVRLHDHLEALRKLDAALGKESTDRLCGFFQQYATAKQAAQAAAEGAFKGEPLPHVGSAAWRTLWEAARLWSQRRTLSGQAADVGRASREVAEYMDLKEVSMVPH